MYEYVFPKLIIFLLRNFLHQGYQKDNFFYDEQLVYLLEAVELHNNALPSFWYYRQNYKKAMEDHSSCKPQKPFNLYHVFVIRY